MFKDEMQMKKHMKTHLYALVQYKGDLCEFMGCDEIDMDVHAAKLHGDKWECWLCKHEANYTECYKCEECSQRI